MPLPENSLPPPSRAALAALCNALLPGSRAIHLRPLPGGLDASMHAVDLVPPGLNGAPLQLVLRRYAPAMPQSGTRQLARGFRVLQLLQQAAFPAPRPLLFDPDGATLEAPGYVMSRLPGRGDLQPRNPIRWLEQLAQALAALHGLPLDSSAAGLLPGPAPTLEERFGAGKLVRIAAHPLGAEILAAVQARGGRVQRAPFVFCHGDYWPGNTVWSRGRLTGVVDWDDARLDSRWSDVAYCRLDLALYFGSRGQELAGLFTRAYEQASGIAAPELSYWDLESAVRALPDPAHWLPSYEGHTPGAITAEAIRANLAEFVRRALSPA